MRETRPSGSEGGGVATSALPTPMATLTTPKTHHPVSVFF